MGVFREHDITVAWRAGTYRLCDIKHGEAFIDYVQHGSIPVL